MLGRKKRWLAAAPVCALIVGCSPIGGEIEQGAGYEDAEPYIGAPASANPLAPIEIPSHPYLAAQGQNGMHSDSYITGTYPWTGPLGINPVIDSASFGGIGGECATATFDQQGRLITVCTDFFNMRLVMMDGSDLNILATHNLPLRDSNKTLNIEIILQDSSGGAYFHLDHLDRPVIANADRHLQVFELVEGEGEYEWSIVSDFDLNPHVEEGALLTDVIPDWQGRLWFATRFGSVGYVDPETSEVFTTTLPGEEIQNALSVSEDGVFIVSDHAIYRFDVDQLSGAPIHTWRETYDRGTAPKPGAINQGSGTTPTLMGDDLVAISDNADDRVNVVVYQRADDFEGDRVVCTVPVFESGISVTENSLIGYGDSIIIENNFGYTTPFDNPWTEAGVTRIDVLPDRSGCEVVWESDEASQTTVPKLSLGNGLIYLYTREAQDDPSVEAWYLTTLDFETGETQYKILTGTGESYNNNWAPITLGPDGTAYIGVLNGMVSVRDGE